jgi:hypothetical protein
MTLNPLSTTTSPDLRSHFRSHKLIDRVKEHFEADTGALTSLNSFPKFCV